MLTYLQAIQYNQFKAVNYFDSPGIYTYKTTNPPQTVTCTWNFDPSGLSAFSDVANSTVFSNRVSP
jgi:hypothetical protein